MFVNRSNCIFAPSGRRRESFASARLVCRFLCFLALAALAACGATRTVAQSAPPFSVSPNQPFAYSDFDGDLRPDLAVVQTGRSDLSLTDYWIQLQLSANGRQAIRIVAPTGGLQIAARDVNGDNAPDLVLTTAWLSRPVAILLNDGHGGFSRVDPTAYPGAFRESKTAWDSSTYQTPDAVALSSTSRTGAYWEPKRLPRARPLARSLPCSSSIVLLSPFLLSQASRAPPPAVPLS